MESPLKHFHYFSIVFPLLLLLLLNLFISNASATLDPRDGVFSFLLSCPNLSSLFLPPRCLLAKGKWCLCLAIRDLDFNERREIFGSETIWWKPNLELLGATCSGTCEPKAFFSRFLAFSWSDSTELPYLVIGILYLLLQKKSVHVCFRDVNNVTLAPMIEPPPPL